MHISDGVLSAPIWIGSYLAATSVLAVTTRAMPPKDIPKIAVMTSCFFIASLIHVPLGPTSVHLILSGLVGITLGRMAFCSIFLGLILQALLFQHGGVTTIGANSLMMGISALLSYKIFSLGKRFYFRSKEVVFGALAGGSGAFMGSLILAAFLALSGEEFIGVAKYALMAHLPIIIMEALVSGFVVSFLIKVKPEILGMKVANNVK